MSNLPINRDSAHPGEILVLEILNPLGVTYVVFAAHLSVPVQRVKKSFVASGA